KKETLRKASKGLVKIHFYVSDLTASSQAISKGSERPESFPLDRPWRLGGHVVDDAVDAADFVDDARGGLGQDVPGELVEVSRHAVGRGDRAQGQHLFIGPGVALDADSLDRQQNGEGLPDVVVQTRLADLVQIDGVRVLKRGDGVRRDLAGDANG